MELRKATVEDIESILKLHAKYQIDSVAENDKKDGFVTTEFSNQQLIDLIEKE